MLYDYSNCCGAPVTMTNDENDEECWLCSKCDKTCGIRVSRTPLDDGIDDDQPSYGRGDFL